MTDSVLVVQEDVTTVVYSAGEQGPVGPQGPMGPAGGAAVYLAAAPVSGHIAVTLDAAGAVIPADPNNPAHGNSIIGITTGAASTGAVASLATQGLVSHAGWAFTPDAPVFIGPAGALTQTPFTGVWQKVVGVARSPTSFMFGPQPAIFV